MNYMEIYKKCMKIRTFERKVESEFSAGRMRGTTHGCVGQEIIPVLVMEHINRNVDYVTGTHRCHGQVIAYTDDSYRLACEMMGKKDGFVNGLGGSQHIKVGNYITNGITGGMLTVGVGIAMGIKKELKDGIVVAFAGDGGVNEGYVQESMNLASHFQLPILFVCENNGYAMSTPTSKFSAGNFRDRISALDIEYRVSSTSVPDELESEVTKAFEFVRNKKIPCFLDIQTARLCGHSKSDSMDYMSEKEKEHNLSEDPLRWLVGKLSANEVKRMNLEISKEIDDIFLKANACMELEYNQ